MRTAELHINKLRPALRLKRILASSVILFSLNGHSQQVSQTFTLDGRLYSDIAATTPLAEAGVTVKVQILNEAQTCILYEEAQVVDTSSADGAFTIQIGSPNSGAQAAKRGSNDAGNTMAQVYSNAVTSISGKLVSNGAACAYIPANGDQRFLRVTVAPASGSAEVLTPNIALDSAPSAIIAERAENLQGLVPANLLQVNATAPANLTQGNLENIFSTTNYPRLTSLLSVPPANYLQAGANGSVGLPQVGGDPGSGLTAGQFWYDSTANKVKYYNGTAVQTLSSGSGITSLTIGGGLTPTGTITTGGTTIAVDAGTAAGQIVQVQAGGKLPALDGTDLTNLNATAIQSGTIGGTTSMNTSGMIVTTNSVTAQNISANGASLRALILNDTGSTPNTATLQAPNTVTASYTLTLPAALGAANQLLQTDASGNLSWVTPAMTSKADATHDGYLAHADWTAFDGKQSSMLANAAIWVGSGGGVATAQTPAGDVSMTNAGVFTVEGVKGKSVSTVPTLTGQVLRYDGANWTPNFVAMTDLRSTITGAGQFASSCSNNQTLTYNSVGDVMSCQNISVPSTQITGLGTAAALNVGTGSNDIVQLDASGNMPAVNGSALTSLNASNISSGTLSTSRLPASVILNGGQAGAITIGPNDANSLTLNTAGSARMTVLSGGNVGIGTTSPVDLLSLGSVNASATHASLNLSNAALSGASSSGTYIGANPASASADFINYQVGGTTKFSVDKNGKITGDGSGLTGIAVGPAGSNTQVQFNNSGTMGASANLVWDNTDGRLGIGAATPGYLLDLRGSTASQIHLSSTSADSGGYLSATGSNGVYLSAGASYNGSQWIAKDASPSILQLDSRTFGFFADESETVGSAYTPKARFFIAAGTGYIGFGTDGPDADLSFGAGADREIDVHRQDVGGLAGNSLTITSGGAYPGAANKSGGDLTLSSGIATGNKSSNIYFQTAAPGSSGTADRTPATTMTILGSGNVGIGTTSPTAKLNVVGTSEFTNGLTTVNFDTDGIWSHGWYNGIWVQREENTTNVMTYPLSLEYKPYGGTAAVGGGPGILFTGQTSTNPTRGMASIGSMWTSVAESSHSADIVFSTVNNGNGAATPSEVVRIKSNGNVGIGTTSPQATLDVAGYARLAANATQPVACTAANDNAFAVTSKHTMCICKGSTTSWVSINDGATACVW